jgi:ankyrin repeat protein
MGSIAFVSTMIEIRPYLMEEKDEYKANCLFYACASGSEKLVEYLLRKGVPRNVENIIGETPLHIAAMFGHLEVLNILSNHFFEICGKLNKQGYNAMYYCSRFGDVDTLKHYKEKGFKIDAKALTIAAKYQQNEVFDFILRETDDVNQGRDEEGRLALHYVVINGNVHAVNELIQKKADITLTDQYNRNVFHLAAEYGQRGVMEILIDEAKKINNLEQLISTKDIFTGRKLSVVVRGKDRGRNAWHWLELKRLYVISFNRAMKSGRVDVARYGKILKSGFGTYPDNECQEMMKKRLADIANEQRNDMTPLLVAVINDNTDLVKILLNNGASPDDQDYKGTTAMHYAAMNNNIYTMHLLSIAGGSLDVKTADGQTPYDIAKDTESSEAINFFCNARQPTQLAKVGER